MNLNEWLTRSKELQFQYRHAEKAKVGEEDALRRAVLEERACEEARDILQAAGQTVQQEAHDRIADTVTRCLQAVFGPSYRFSIVLERKRGRTEAKMEFGKDGMRLDPLASSGGGVIDVAAFALRVACLMLTKPPLRKILLLDEPMKHLSQNLRPRVAELIESISKELNIQILLVTHDASFIVGKIIQLA